MTASTLFYAQEAGGDECVVARDKPIGGSALC